MANVTKTESRKEVIYIEYYDIIKSPWVYILKQLKTDKELNALYKEYVNLVILRNMSDMDMYGLNIKRLTYNIFEYMALQPFDYKNTLAKLLIRFGENAYMNAHTLDIGISIANLCNEKFVTKIYIHTNEYDKLVHEDIQRLSHNDKVTYCTGTINDVLDTSKGDITTFIINDIEDIQCIIDKNKIKGTNVMLANYGYNYMVDNETPRLKLPVYKLEKTHEFNFTIFNPYMNATPIVFNKPNNNKVSDDTTVNK